MAEETRSALATRLQRMLGESRRPSCTEEQLRRALGVEAREIAAALAELEREGEAVRLPRKRWALADRSGLLTGRVKIDRSGRAMVILDVPDAPLVLERSALRPAMDGDRVLVEETPFARGGLHRAKIHRVLERGRDIVVGVASEKAPRRLLPMDERLGPYLVLLADGSDPAPPGKVVAARIVEYPSAHRDVTVEVDRVLGEAGRLETEIRSACLVRGIEDEFADDVLAEADAFAEPTDADFAGRRDLRGDVTFTIDPADAKDHDDAVAIEETDDGWRLTVSIADVSHYVRPGSRLDLEAYERSTSVYFPGRAVPMLPERLSGDLASLHPGIDRLAVSVFLEIDRRGRVRGATFARSVIHSVASLTYEQVQAVLDEEGFKAASVAAPAREDDPDGREGDADLDEGGTSGAADAAHEVAGSDHAADAPRERPAQTARSPRAEKPAPTAGIADEVREAVTAMAECADALHRRRMKRGAIDMNLPESVIVLDDAGVVKTVRRRPRLFAHRLVEECMLAANEAVAERIDRSDGAFLYRIHERPDDDAITQLATRVRALGLRLQREGGIVEPSMFQDLLEQAAGCAEERQVNNMVLRTMTQARYSADKDIHFGLASRCYTHFTSPIRRYPDIVAHRALLALEGGAAAGKASGNGVARGVRGAIPATDTDAASDGPDESSARNSGASALPSREALRPVAGHTSSRERRAMDAERDVAAAAACLWAARRIGKRLDGTISSVERYGYRVELDAAFVEGFVHVGKLREYFDYVTEKMELQSRVSSACIRIGQRATVRIVAVDLGARRIELEPAG